ncbi:MAG: HAMP domain-containing protein [Candidatus Eisenbacteria bacterium]|nr:HAMP domain-containing protein [Candidatus Eisenbacteria bacterium]
MRLGLRWKILLLTVLTPVSLAVATLVMVDRDVAEHVDASSLHENLGHSAAVFEGMLATRMRALEGGALVVAQDPRFFSLLMLGLDQRDARFDATVRGMAHDFNGITQTDVFEVFDRRGRLVTSVGESKSSPDARKALVARALGGEVTTGVLAEGRTHYQAVAVPVRADGRQVGVLMLGAEIGTALASDLRTQMRCEVSFLSGRAITGTTLPDASDRQKLLDALNQIQLGPDTNPVRLGLLRVHGAREYLTLVRRIPGTSASAMQFYVLQRAFDPEAAFQKAIRNDLVALAAVALMLAIATSLIFSEQIVRPLQKLVLGAKEMEAGNYEHPIEVRRDDEVGYLADQFTRMRAREQAYVKSLEQATRLKSEFISIASHELRTPISVLSGYRDLLAEGSLGPLSPRQSRVVESMHEYLERLGRVAEDAAMVAEMRNERLSLDRKSVPVRSIVQVAVEAARQSAAGRAVEVATSISAPEAKVEVDHQALVQALTHLITNGVRFTPDGGRVEVRADIEEDQLRIVVADTGVGMSEGSVESLRAHGAAQRDAAHHRSSVGLEFGSGGLGLGFSLARGIVAAHGGRIEIESRTGHGSTFTILVPVGGEQELRAAA